MDKKREILIQELYEEMEKELNKEPEKMDIDKIRAMNVEIAHLEGNTELPKSLKKENFFREFDQKYGFHFKDEESSVPDKKRAFKQVRHGIKWKVIAACIMLCLVLGVGNAVSVAAVDKSLWQIIEETTHSFYYVSNGDISENEQLEVISNESEAFSSWEEIVGSSSFELLNFGYLPEDMKLQQGIKTDYDGIVEIQGYFVSDSNYFNVLCEYTNSAGIGDMNKSGNFELKRIGAREVYISNGDDKTASFVEKNILYSINTNLEMSELEKIIKNME